MSVTIPYLDDRGQQAAYLISLADQVPVPHSDIEHVRDGFRVPDDVYAMYDENAVLLYSPASSPGGSIVVVYAGSDLDTPRAGGSINYWKFDYGVDPGVNGENVTNGRVGDLVFVAT